MIPERGFKADWDEQAGRDVYTCRMCPQESWVLADIEEHLLAAHPDEDVQPSTFAAGFTLARMIGDPDVVQIAREAGYLGHERVICAYPDTPVHEVVTLAFGNPEGPLWLAMVDEAAACRVRMLRLRGGSNV